MFKALCVVDEFDLRMISPLLANRSDTGSGFGQLRSNVIISAWFAPLQCLVVIDLEEADVAPPRKIVVRKCCRADHLRSTMPWVILWRGRHIQDEPFCGSSLRARSASWHFATTCPPGMIRMDAERRRLAEATPRGSRTARPFRRQVILVQPVQMSSFPTSAIRRAIAATVCGIF